MGEYEEFVKRLKTRILDPYTSIDERIDFLGPRVVDALSRIKKVEESMGIAPAAEIEQIPFAYNLSPLQGVTLLEEAPFDGYIKQVTIHYPDGCDALVDVRVGHGTEQFCPREGYLALNDATPTYPFNVEVEQGDDIWVEMRNTDSVNSHSITVTLSLEEKK